MIRTDIITPEWLLEEGFNLKKGFYVRGIWKLLPLSNHHWLVSNDKKFSCSGVRLKGQLHTILNAGSVENVVAAFSKKAQVAALPQKPLNIPKQIPIGEYLRRKTPVPLIERWIGK